MIARVVPAFYAEICRALWLGPVFDQRIHDRTAHLGRMGVVLGHAETRIAYPNETAAPPQRSFAGSSKALAIKRSKMKWLLPSTQVAADAAAVVVLDGAGRTPSSGIGHRASVSGSGGRHHARRTPEVRR